MGAININQLIQKDQYRQTGNWSSSLFSRLVSLNLPTHLGFFSKLNAQTFSLLQLSPDGFQLFEMQEGKTRTCVLDWKCRRFLINNRLAQKEELKTLLNSLKALVSLGKTSSFSTYKSSEIEFEQVKQAIIHEAQLPPSDFATPVIGVLAVIGKTIHSLTTEQGSLITSFVDKTNRLLISLKNGFNKLIIHNAVERPKPPLKYQLAIEKLCGDYLEKSHFVSNKIHVSFDPQAITINNQPISETGCSWFSDKLGKLAQDIAGGRAGLFEEKELKTVGKF